MSIIRGPINIDSHYTIVPNDWVRDRRLSRKARGLLAELRSHREGWVITFDSLVDNGPEGIEAIRTAVRELEECGYLQRNRVRGDKGRLQGMSYTLTDPPAQAISPTSGFPTLADPTLDNPTPKKTIPPEDDGQEDQKNLSPAARGGETDAAFDEFWSLYPKLVGKRAARMAFDRALRRAPAEAICAGTARYRAERAGKGDRYTANPATWLNADRWEDAPSRPEPTDQGTTTAKVQGWLSLGDNTPDSRPAIEGDWA